MPDYIIKSRRLLSIPVPVVMAAMRSATIWCLTWAMAARPSEILRLHFGGMWPHSIGLVCAYCAAMTPIIDAPLAAFLVVFFSHNRLRPKDPPWKRQLAMVFVSNWDKTNSV
jgi:hypothetical protein